MATQSISFEPEVLAWVVEQAKKTGHGISFMVNFYCQKAREEDTKSRPQMLICKRHPGITYSSKLNQCPMCAEEDTIKKIEEADIETIEARNTATKELEEVNDKMAKLSEKINTLDTETEGGKTKFDNLNREFDKLKSRREELLSRL